MNLRTNLGAKFTLEELFGLNERIEGEEEGSGGVGILKAAAIDGIISNYHVGLGSPVEESSQYQIRYSQSEQQTEPEIPYKQSNELQTEANTV